MATVNVRGDGEVTIYELDADGAVERAWWFALAPGDVWAMPGDDAHGYVRWACDHGLRLVHGVSKRACAAGCGECRISLNFRFGW